MTDSHSVPTTTTTETQLPKLQIDALELHAIEDCLTLLQHLTSAWKRSQSPVDGQARLVFLRLELRLLFLASVCRNLSRPESERLSWLQSQALSLFPGP